jgi:cytochrome c-type biogenesis protein CcmF
VVQVYKDGQPVAELHPRTDYYWDAQQSMTIPGVRSTFQDDVYVILVNWEPTTATGATFKVYLNPLVNWLWIGSLLFIFGIIIAAWPEKETESVSVSSAVSAQTSAAD